MTNHVSVTAVVPLLNEEKTIGHVVQQLLKNHLITEVICVMDNGSIDNSRKILRSFGKKIILLDIGKNKGKGNAMVHGIKAATGDIIMFFDADITNLTTRSVNKLLKPLEDKKIRAVLGYPFARHYLAKLFLPLTGERVYYRKDLVSHLRKIQKVGYGTEQYLNTLFTKEQTAVVPLDNLKLLEKREKHGLQKSINNELKAMWQISKEMAIQEGLLPREYKILDRLTLGNDVQFADVSKKLIDKLQNKQMRKIVRSVYRDLLFYYRYKPHKRILLTSRRYLKRYFSTRKW